MPVAPTIAIIGCRALELAVGICFSEVRNIRFLNDVPASDLCLLKKLSVRRVRRKVADP